MRKLALVFLALTATAVLSLGLSWLLHLASRPNDLYVATGLIGSAVLFYLYWEVLKLCLKHFRREVRGSRENPGSASTNKELPS
jgi:phosphate starvation-inducible membrane PsiE